MTLSASQARDVPLEMIHQIAFGIEDPAIIAGRHGFTLWQFEQLAEQDWFHAAVEQRKLQLQAEGMTFRTKARMMAEDGLESLYKFMRTSTKADFVLEAVRYLAKVADLEPKANSVAQTGTGFSITINMPSTVTTTSQTLVMHPDLGPAPDYLNGWTPPAFLEAAE